VDTLSELQQWGESMRGRTARQLALSGSTPSGWHLLLPGGDFGFHDVKMPENAEDHLLLVAQVRDAMRELAARASLFVTERELADGRPVLFLQFEAVDGRGRRARAITLHRVVTTPQGRRVDEHEVVVPERPEDQALVRDGLFPDLLPDPPSPLRIL
jgi:hypothetical protein